MSKKKRRPQSTDEVKVNFKIDKLQDSYVTCANCRWCLGCADRSENGGCYFGLEKNK